SVSHHGDWPRRRTDPVGRGRVRAGAGEGSVYPSERRSVAGGASVPPVFFGTLAVSRRGRSPAAGICGVMLHGTAAALAMFLANAAARRRWARAAKGSGTRQGQRLAHAHRAAGGQTLGPLHLLRAEQDDGGGTQLEAAQLATLGQLDGGA